MSNRTILAIQVSGWAAALALLCFMHGPAQVVFSAAFGVHLVGDLLRLKKDGLI